jgi:hypothetical protein
MIILRSMTLEAATPGSQRRTSEVCAKFLAASVMQIKGLAVNRRSVSTPISMVAH